MRAVISKTKIESEIAGRFGKALTLQEKVKPLTLSTGVSELDEFTGGLPRGAVTEIFGPASSGRTSLLCSILAHATTHDEICAIVDTQDVFAPTVAAKAGIDFDSLLWIRCGANLEHAFKATDLLLHAGGFGLVALDLGDVTTKDTRRIISSWWHRFRYTVENKPITVVVLTTESCVRSCAALSLELNARSEWCCTKELKLTTQVHELTPGKAAQRANLNTASVTHGNLLRFNSSNAIRQRPITPNINQVHFKARAR